MDLELKLSGKYKELQIRPINEWNEYLKKRWEENFARSLSDKEKEDIFLLNGFLWHIFSYDKVDYLKENDAKDSFDKINKNFLYVFYQLENEAYIIENTKNLKASDFNGQGDIYITDKDFTFTYVNTHEEGYLGPYFFDKTYKKELKE